LSIPVFIAQADGLLAEITGVESPMMKAASVLREKYADDPIRQGRDTGARELVGMRCGLVGFGPAGPNPKLQLSIAPNLG